MDPIVTVREVGNKMYARLNQERIDIMNRRMELEEELRQLNERDREIDLEFQIVEAGMNQNIGRIHVQNNLTFNIGTQIIDNSKISLDDAVRKLFDEYGRPVRIGQIIKDLEQFGFMWSKGSGAANRAIIQVQGIEPTGVSGYYNFRR